MSLFAHPRCTQRQPNSEIFRAKYSDSPVLGDHVLSKSLTIVKKNMSKQTHLFCERCLTFWFSMAPLLQCLFVFCTNTCYPKHSYLQHYVLFQNDLDVFLCANTSQVFIYWTIAYTSKSLHCFYRLLSATTSIKDVLQDTTSLSGYAFPTSRLNMYDHDL